jgi:hypothetical protein
MPIFSAVDSTFELLPLLTHEPFVHESSTLNIQDLLYDLRVTPLAEKCMTVGHVPNHPFVVTRVTWYNEQSTWLGHQHAYVVLKVQPHPSQPQPPWSHTFIKIFGRNKGNPLLAHLGLYLHAEGTSTIVDSPAANDKVVHSELSWSPEWAPPLFRVINLIIKVNIYHERYWGWYKSCHILAAAILDAVYDVFDDTPEILKIHPFINQPYSFRINYAARIAKRACNSYRMNGKFF